MADHTLQFTLSPEQFASKKAQIVSAGVSIGDGNSGEINYMGVDATFVYDGVSLLTITIEHKPFIISEGSLEQKITDWFKT